MDSVKTMAAEMSERDRGLLGNGQGLGFELAFSFIVSALILNAVLIIKIKYGGMMITHNTMRPYIVSMCLLLVCLLEVTLYLIMKVYFVNDWFGFLNFVKSNPWLEILFLTTTNAKFALVLFFVLTRIFEPHSLAFFISYQQSQTL